MSEPDPRLTGHVRSIVDAVREPLELDRWEIRVDAGPEEEDGGRATCIPLPEYRCATINFDFDRIQTGDDLAELAVHEMTHCHTAPLHDLAIALADALADVAPKYMRKGLRKKLQEEVRLAAEATTTDVGHTYLRLLRRAGILPTPEAT
jgi:hypothetical protein